MLRVYGVQEAKEAQGLRSYAILHNLTVRASLPMPKFYVLPAQGADAFAIGRNPSDTAVAVTEGIVQLIEERELTGVLRP